MNFFQALTRIVYPFWLELAFIFSAGTGTTQHLFFGGISLFPYGLG
jgi:hypothetical protein